MSESLPAITLPPAQNPQQEGEWLQKFCSGGSIKFLAEPVNQQIAQRAAQILSGSGWKVKTILALVIAIVTDASV